MTATTAYRRISHVIYDLDGILLDTEPIYSRATQQILDRFGLRFDWSVKARMMGKPPAEASAILVAALGLPQSPEQFTREMDDRLAALFPEAPPMPGAVRLTTWLHRRGIPQAVATSSHRDSFEIKRSRLRKWFDRFDVIVTGDDPAIRKGKPAPDIFLVAAKRLGANPDSCLVFEDSPAGVAAGLAAGMAVVAIPAPQIEPGEFAAANLVIESFDRFAPEPWGLPSPIEPNGQTSSDVDP